MKVYNKGNIRELYKKATKTVDGAGDSFKQAVEKSAKAASAKAPASPARKTGVDSAQPDQIALKADEKAVSSAVNLVAKAPDIREARVQKIADQIAKGTYKVDAQAVAERILASGVLDDEI